MTGDARAALADELYRSDSWWPKYGTDTAEELADRITSRLADGLTDEIVERELHRVLCGNRTHRSRFTGECRGAPNVARGLRAALLPGRA